MIAADRQALDELDTRIRTVLPEDYQETYDTIQPTPMRAAGLKYGDDGLVAWDQIWGSFCDLAMAGGPPHKGRLLEPGDAAAIEANRDAYGLVAGEICRGISMATLLPADVSSDPGWIAVECYSEAMAGWLLRAITMENVAVRADGVRIHLPAAPGFRLEREVKNVVTVIAKTSHYWLGHMPRWQQRAIAALFGAIGQRDPLVVPARAGGARTNVDNRHAAALAARIAERTGLAESQVRYAGWLGLECPGVRPAVWMMRALVVSQVLARREGTSLFVPINETIDPGGDRVASTLGTVHRLAAASGVL